MLNYNPDLAKELRVGLEQVVFEQARYGLQEESTAPFVQTCPTLVHEQKRKHPPSELSTEEAWFCSLENLMFCILSLYCRAERNAKATIHSCAPAKPITIKYRWPKASMCHVGVK